MLTLLLTSVALKFSVDDRLPQTPYLTVRPPLSVSFFVSQRAANLPFSTRAHGQLMDRYIIGSWVLMGAVTGCHAGTQYITDEDLAENIDYYAGFGLGAFWLLLHLVFAVIGASGGMHDSWEVVEESQVDVMRALEPDKVLGVEMTDEERQILAREQSDEFFE